MEKFLRGLALISVLVLAGQGCVLPFRAGDVPTEAQLARMSPEEKEAAMQAMLEREPAPEFNANEAKKARMEAIEAMRDGTAERLADFRATLTEEQRAKHDKLRRRYGGPPGEGPPPPPPPPP